MKKDKLIILMLLILSFHTAEAQEEKVYPQVAVIYDIDPVQAIEPRQKPLKFVSKNKIRIAGMHIEYPGIGDIRGDNTKGYVFSLLCTCEGTFR